MQLTWNKIEPSYRFAEHRPLNYLEFWYMLRWWNPRIIIRLWVRSLTPLTCILPILERIRLSSGERNLYLPCRKKWVEENFKLNLMVSLGSCKICQEIIVAFSSFQTNRKLDKWNIMPILATAFANKIGINETKNVLFTSPIGEMTLLEVNETIFLPRQCFVR